MYRLIIKPLLFSLQPETAHHIAFRLLKLASFIPGMNTLMRSMFQISDKRLEREIFGIRFPNPVGLAAGFDKDAKAIDGLGNLGFGFVEVGTLTPKGQSGNDKPRLFRLPKDKALINRMGFNNEGMGAAVSRLKKRKSNIIVGGNIGKNKVTPNEDAYNDYELCLDTLYDFVDYFVINISSPNTPGLRELQEKEPLKKLLRGLKNRVSSKSTRKPMLLKIAPDLTDPQLDDIIEIIKEVELDGVVATNTTIERSGLTTSEKDVSVIGQGGLSGAPVASRSTAVIRYLRDGLGKSIPIIGVGGIMTAKDALEKMEAGADLIQVYTGFVYEGPSFVKKINRAILKEI